MNSVKISAVVLATSALLVGSALAQGLSTSPQSPGQNPGAVGSPSTSAPAEMAPRAKAKVAKKTKAKKRKPAAGSSGSPAPMGTESSE